MIFISLIQIIRGNFNIINKLYIGFSTDQHLKIKVEAFNVRFSMKKNTKIG